VNLTDIVITVPAELWDTGRNALAAAGVRLDKVDSSPGQAPRYLASDTRPENRSTDLTDREAQALRGIAAGRSNAEIGRDLGLSEDTVKTYVRSLFRKLGARNRFHAVALAYEGGRLGGGAR
jgi:DNA-binding CsgD family transcriptional regulator